MESVPYESLAPPPQAALLREALAIKEVPRLLFRLPKAATLPRGSARAVVIPGYGTTDTATRPIRAFLRSLGHSTFGWGQGRNIGDVNAQIGGFRAEVAGRSGEGATPVALIGWSLGGVFAREVARDHPEWVSQVVTLATPVVGGPRFTRSARDYEPATLDEIESQVTERNRKPIESPITAFYTKLDGVVDWRACIDTMNPHVEHIEVGSTHAGITLDPDVWGAIARLLADSGERD